METFFREPSSDDFASPTPAVKRKNQAPTESTSKRPRETTEFRNNYEWLLNTESSGIAANFPFDVVFCLPPKEGEPAYPTSTSNIMDVPPDRVIAYAHKIVLAANCSYFRTKYAMPSSESFVSYRDTQGREIIMEVELSEPNILKLFIDLLYYLPHARSCKPGNSGLEDTIRYIHLYEVAHLYDCLPIMEIAIQQVSDCAGLSTNTKKSEIQADDQFDRIQCIFVALEQYTHLNQSKYQNRKGVDYLFHRALLVFVQYVARHRSGWMEITKTFAPDTMAEFISHALLHVSDSMPAFAPHQQDHIHVSDFEYALREWDHAAPDKIRASTLFMLLQHYPYQRIHDRDWLNSLFDAVIANEKFTVEQTSVFYRTIMGLT